MATDWKSKYGAGKWVTIRGAHVYVQEGKGLGSALQKLAGKKKTIKSPARKLPKMSDVEKNVIDQNEKTIANGRKMWNEARGSGDANKINAAREAIGRGKNAIQTNRLLKGRTSESRYGDLVRNTGAADYNNANRQDSFESWGHSIHEQGVKAGIKTARAAREASGTNGKLRSPVYADQNTGKLKISKSKLPGKVKTNEAGKKTLEDRRIKSNEEKIKKYNQADPNKDWESFTKLDDAARKARYENQMIKAKREPGRGQTINDYRNPQFTKGDNYSLVGNRHVTSRVNPDASKTGTADQELNQLYAQRRPYGNRTYTDPRIKGSWEESTKEILKNAQAARKANGTEGKLRSDVYKDSPQQEAAANAKKFAQKTKTTRGGTSTPTLKEALKEKAGKKTRKK